MICFHTLCFTPPWTGDGYAVILTNRLYGHQVCLKSLEVEQKLVTDLRLEWHIQFLVFLTLLYLIPTHGLSNKAY